jgi:hypothetical protein
MAKKKGHLRGVVPFFVSKHEVGFKRIEPQFNVASGDSLLWRKVLGFAALPSIGFGLVKH